MTAHNLFTIGWTMLWLAVYFLPTLVAIFTQHPRYMIVGIYNAMAIAAIIANPWFAVGWLLLLWLVLCHHYPALAIRRRAA